MRIKKNLINIYERMKRYLQQKGETKKINDERRKEIIAQVNLTHEQISKAEQLFKNNYGKTLSLAWHKEYTAFTGKYDVNYFPELLYIPEFERYMNYNRAYTEVLEDKNILPLFAKAAGVKTASKIISCQEGIFTDNMGNQISILEAIEKLKNIGLCFAKPSVGTCSGEGCRLLNIKDGIDINSNNTIEQILKSFGKNFLIQEKITCHKTIAKIYPSSVNTFRVMTYRWKDQICVAPIIMRIGRNGNVVDNAHAGGIFIAINNDGTLHKKAFTEFKDEFITHPDTNIKFEGYKIEGFEKVIEAVKKLHVLVPNIGVINWDMTIDEAGIPNLIEANINGGSIWLFQMAHGQGVFGEKTAEILRWLNKVKKAGYSNIDKMSFGK